jgi:hypothetical protein
VKILSASDKADYDYFGSSVAVSGDTVVVGAPYANSGGTARGQAYVFSRNQGGTNNWGEVKILSASDQADNDYFGWSVAVSGDTVVVGAYAADSGGTYRGQAYVFSRNQGGPDFWGQVKILSASDRADNDYFGSSVAISGDIVVVGAHYAASGGTGRGQAYIFSRNQGGTNNWGLVKILSTSDKADNDLFGSSVAISWDTVVVGAPYANSGGTDRGQAYVFSRNQGGTNNWGEVEILSASDQADNDYFGSSVAVSGDTVVVGAYLADYGGTDRGQAYVFSRNQGGTNNWGEVEILSASDKADFNYFGRSVAISGDIVVVGAHYAASGGTYRGQAYVFLQSVPSVSKIGVFRNSHDWYLDSNGNGTWDGNVIDRQYALGKVGDIPVVGDWNGNGITEIGVFRDNHTWNVDYNGNGIWEGVAGGDRIYITGKPGDVPVPGDWNGNNITEMAVFRGNHTWYIDYNGNGLWDSPAGGDRIYITGKPGDIPVPGDWNGDGITEMAVFRGSHTWYIDYNGNGVWDSPFGGDRIYTTGQPGDIPVFGDWNGDRLFEMGVFRPSNHNFYLDFNANGLWDGASVDRRYDFGTFGDIPVSGKW